MSRFVVWFAWKLGCDLCTAVRAAIHHTGTEVPRQLLKLVKQAHSGRPEDMVWDIAVSPEMRDKLCLPLTPEQLTVMRAAENGVYTTSVNGYVFSHKFRNGELSGVVQVWVTVYCRYSKSKLDYPPAKLRIVVRQQEGQHPYPRWTVVSVEQIA